MPVYIPTIDDTRDIDREALLNLIEQELPQKAKDGIHGTNATPSTVYSTSNMPSHSSIGINEARLGDGELYVQDFISLNRDIKDDDITETIVATALRCTQVRRATYVENSNDTTVLFHLDIASQQWYEEFNQLGRKYSIESERDIVRTGIEGAAINTDAISLDPDEIEGAIELVSRVLTWHRTNATIIDIRTCHGDCHGNCHSSRSRR